MDESVIPKGIYCYDENGVCPYWSLDPDLPYQRNGRCAFLKRSDSDVTSPNLPDKLQSASSLLWDQCKECGVNDDSDDCEYEDDL